VNEYRFKRYEVYCQYLSQVPQIDQMTKALVVKALEEASTEYGLEEHDYIVRKIDRKLEIVGDNKLNWVKELGEGYSKIYKWYLDNFDISLNLVKKVGASIFYFVNPFDIIPDHTLEFGYADDAFAFNYTLRVLPKEWYV